jgi:hypothetical protein
MVSQHINIACFSFVLMALYLTVYWNAKQTTTVSCNDVSALQL